MAEAEQAIDYLRHECVPAADRGGDAALLAEWQAARAKIGPPFRNAGHAAVLDLPAEAQPYMDELVKQPWVADRLRNVEDASFRLVEVDPLLANQFSIGTDRLTPFNEGPGAPGMADLLRLCLPMAHPPLEYQASPVSSHSTSVMLTSRRRDFTFRRFGVFASERAQMTLVGARVELPLPFVHVVRLGGRCYLHNGYHRAYSARLAGATHVPCFLRDVADLKASGLPDDGSTFPPSLLASKNPPTMAHYTQGRAHHVALRVKRRIIHVTWHQYLVDAE